MRVRAFFGAILIVSVCVPDKVIGANFLVVNTDDGGAGSLRQAILDANTNAGTDQITFAIPGPGPHTIFPVPPLPVVTESVLIDGYSQPLSNPNTLAQGNNASLRIRLLTAGNGLRIATSNCTVRGLAIVRGGDFATGHAIEISAGSSNKIEGCFVGVDTDGASVPLPGGGYGISLSSNTVANTVGGATPEARNVISGNADGIRLDGVLNVVKGNYIGTDATGRRAATNEAAGIRLGGSTNIIGGELPGSGNLISGNRFGIAETSLTSPPRGAVIRGNLIGTDCTGTRKLGNRASGIVFGLAQHTMIGGTTAGAGNVISGNAEDGIALNSALSFTNFILGNLIGTDVSGTFDLGNGRNGVWAITWYHQIGGSEAGAANVIAFNKGFGVSAFMGPNLISGNSIFSNGGGIESYFPSNSFLVLSSATATSTGLVVSGMMNASPRSAFRIEVFSSPECDASGFGEGKTFLSWADIVTDAVGHADFSCALPFLPSGEHFLTATATDTNKNTSEFSACLDAPLPRLAIATANSSEVVITWPHSSPEFGLQFKDDLVPAFQWQPVGSGILSNESGWTFVITNNPNSPGPQRRFYRLKYP